MKIKDYCAHLIFLSLSSYEEFLFIFTLFIQELEMFLYIKVPTKHVVKEVYQVDALIPL